MSMTDPLGDMITRIRNAQLARKSTTLCPASKLRGWVLDVLTREGYIRGYERSESSEGKPVFEIALKYVDGEPAIREIGRVSRPGRRVYSSIKALPKHYNGLGIQILSTPRGVMSDAEARTANVGGEVLCKVF
ncbi:MAG: 30S ribosomal protein S8 [Tistrella sp.]|jgi:small subunit ribosomal protein S8|uniref:Small ribosomal subunit protein uS8 n=2 Tax=Tistrella mobilis TaxID=171437 RepID=I3TNW8_TISMK|nr:MULTISPECIES: 30S ribosomal protein S8 [Tistrella]AFK54456.1 30S ribosomal protein S8 [Tistrella mobilis KA081020-065]KYO55466.1 30S ribosomal protein S8 [Tistrella mobilis]MAD37745.1 30S ribosomal protein S8 [Tistrella sp.]MAM75800.1 30S ribosomal protein S8 [Tistrella sp.]MBA74998.1 30S ribosomal protein S8 [Tistrella sp.]